MNSLNTIELALSYMFDDFPTKVLLEYLVNRLSSSWANLTGSMTADTTGATVTGKGPMFVSSLGRTAPSDGCWVLVDEDWRPSGKLVALIVDRSTPFNRPLMSAGAAQRVSLDYATLCAGMIFNGSSSYREAEGVRKINELYLGENGRYAFDNRNFLEMARIRQSVPAAAEELYARLTTGQLFLVRGETEGFRWYTRGGEWASYDESGRLVAYGEPVRNFVFEAYHVVKEHVCQSNQPSEARKQRQRCCRVSRKNS